MSGKPPNRCAVRPTGPAGNKTFRFKPHNFSRELSDNQRPYFQFLQHTLDLQKNGNDVDVTASLRVHSHGYKTSGTAPEPGRAPRISYTLRSDTGDAVTLSDVAVADFEDDTRGPDGDRGGQDKIRDRKRQLEGQIVALNQREERSRNDQESLSRLESFCETISQELDQLNFEEKQSVLRLIVERVILDGNKVRIEAIIPLDEKPSDLVRLRPQGGNPGVDGDPHQPAPPSSRCKNRSSQERCWLI